MENFIINLSLIVILYFVHFLVNFKDTWNYSIDSYNRLLLSISLETDEEYWNKYSYNIKYGIFIDIWILAGIIFAFNTAFLFMTIYSLLKIIYDFFVYKYELSFASFLIPSYIYNISMGLFTLYIIIEYSSIWNNL